MYYFRLGRRVFLHKETKLLPCKALPLTSPIDPFKEDLNRLVKEERNFLVVMGDPVVLAVSCQLSTKGFPERYKLHLMSILLCPLFNFYEFASEPFSYRL